ncbi:MAG: hypothetical protein EA398_07765 [Deltaproteobacteria bacterium]|nr:MAG: hypothetical protein EA398_07765 [Deltaproteobacteria bacterium]
MHATPDSTASAPHRPIAVGRAAVRSADSPEVRINRCFTAAGLLFRHLTAILLARELARSPRHPELDRRLEELLRPPAPSLGTLSQFVEWAARSGSGEDFCPPLHHWAQRRNDHRGPVLLERLVRLRNQHAHPSHVRSTSGSRSSAEAVGALVEDIVEELAFLVEWPLVHIDRVQILPGLPATYEITATLLHGDGVHPPRCTLLGSTPLPTESIQLLRPDLREALRLDPLLDWLRYDDGRRSLLLFHGCDRKRQLARTALLDDHEDPIDPDRTRTLLQDAHFQRIATDLRYGQHATPRAATATAGEAPHQAPDPPGEHDGPGPRTTPGAGAPGRGIRLLALGAGLAVGLLLLIGWLLRPAVEEEPATPTEHPDHGPIAERAVQLAREEASLRSQGAQQAYFALFAPTDEFVCWFGAASLQPGSSRAFHGRADRPRTVPTDGTWTTLWTDEHRAIVLHQPGSALHRKVLFMDRLDTLRPRIVGEAGVDAEGNPRVHDDCAADWTPRVAALVREALRTP